MAKTIYPQNALVLGYEVDTTVVSSGQIDGGTYVNPSPPPATLPNPPIGVWVVPSSLAGISVNALLEIAGIGQVTVTGLGPGAGGVPAGAFTYGSDSEPVPGPGASIRTPWLVSGALLYTRANNSVSLTYYLPDTHDLYFDTFKTSDSGLIDVTLDGNSLGTFDLQDLASNVLASVLLAANVAPGTHTVVVTADITAPRVFVYVQDLLMLEHVAETGGEYLDLGPAGTLDDSTNNYLGNWSMSGAYAVNNDAAGSVFFYPQLDTGGKITFRTQTTPDSAIVGLYVNDVFQRNIDLYSNPALGLVEITVLDTGTGDATGQYKIELRNTGTHNASSTGFLFYFKSCVVYFSRTNTQALTLAANYLKQVAAIRGDGAILDAYDSQRINFDSNALYACMGLLAAYQSLNDASYLTVVKNFLTWLSTMQLSNPGTPFDDGSWKIGYQVNPSAPPTYIPAIAPYDLEGITEIRWVDAVQCLPSFVLWWYWKLSGDNATLAALLPTFRKGIDGFIANNYDPSTGFFYSSWQNKPGSGGWQILAERYSAGQSDVALGLTALWLMTRATKYARLTALLIRRFAGKFWDAADGRWYIALGGANAVPDNTWYPMPHGYTPFVQKQSRFFQPTSCLAQGLTAMEAYQTSEGGFAIPGYDAEHIFSSIYTLGENQLAAPTSPADLALAVNYIKSGQWLMTLGGNPVGGIVFSKRYPYLYTNQAGFACLALARTMNPFTEQLKFSKSRMVMKQ